MNRLSGLVISAVVMFALGGCGSGGDGAADDEPLGGGDVGMTDVADAGGENTDDEEGDPDAGDDESDEDAEESEDDESGYDMDIPLENLDVETYQKRRVEIYNLASCTTAFNDCPNKVRALSTARRATNVRECVESVTSGYRGNLLVDSAVASGEVEFDAEAAESCLSNILNKVKNDVCYLTSPSDTAACEDVFTGTIATGESCDLSEACVSDNCELSRDSQTGRCEGTCIEGQEPAAKGETCDGIDVRCDGTQDLICNKKKGSPEEQVCTERGIRKEGELCRGHDACEDGLLCLGSVCRTRELSGFGEDCVPSPAHSTAVSSMPCAPGLVCVDADGSFTCAPLGSEGDSCAQTDECKHGFYCDGESNTCAPTKAEGEECANWEECKGNMSCRPGSDGDTCQTTPHGAQAC